MTSHAVELDIIFIWFIYSHLFRRVYMFEFQLKRQQQQLV